MARDEDAGLGSLHADGTGDDEKSPNSDPEADNPCEAAVDMARNIMDLEDKGDEPKVINETNVKDWVQHMLKYVTMKTLSDPCKRNNIPNRYEAKPEKLARIVLWCHQEVTE